MRINADSKTSNQRLSALQSLRRSATYFLCFLQIALLKFTAMVLITLICIFISPNTHFTWMAILYDWVLLMIDLPVFSMQFSAFGRDLRRRVKEFLPRHKGRLTRLSQVVMQSEVYDVYTPTEYVRTGDLKESTIAYLPDPSDTQTMFIEPVWDASVGGTTSHAKIGGGGYGKYVAGEGPGIGFLSRTAPDVFPRDFPEAIFQAVKADVFNRFQTEVVDKALAKL